MKKGPSKDVYSEKTSHIPKPLQNTRFITTGHFNSSHVNKDWCDKEMECLTCFHLKNHQKRFLHLSSNQGQISIIDLAKNQAMLGILSQKYVAILSSPDNCNQIHCHTTHIMWLYCQRLL